MLHRRSVLQRALLAIGLVLFGVWTVVPLLWIVTTSIKPDDELYNHPTIVPHALTTEHYISLILDTNFVRYFANSLLVSVITMLISMIIGVLSAYSLTRLRFVGRRLMANVTVVTYLIPAALLFIPLFQVAANYHLTNKTVGLVPIYLIFSVPFCTWLCISHLQSVPFELEEASYIDGCTRFQSLLRIVLPLILPALAVVGLFAFTEAWNEFLYALILITSDSQMTLPIGLAGFIVGDVYVWGPLMACAVISSVVPVGIYLLAQRWVVQGLTAGATKG